MIRSQQELRSSVEQRREINWRHKEASQGFQTFSSCHNLLWTSVMLRSLGSMAAGTGPRQEYVIVCCAETVLKAEPRLGGNGEEKSLSLNLKLIWGFVLSQLR